MSRTDPATAAPEQVDRSPVTWTALAARLAIVLALLTAADRGLGSALLALQRLTLRGDVSGGFANGVRAARPEVLVLGSSRAQAAYDDRAIGRALGRRCFNAGLGGRGLLHARGLQALVAGSAPPELVVVDACWFEDERDRAGVLAPFFGESAVLDAILTGRRPGPRLKLASRLYRMQGRLPTTLRFLGRPAPASGFRPKHGTMSERPLRIDALRARARVPPGYEAELRGLVGDVRRRGGRVVFVEAPSWGQPLPEPVLETWERVAREEAVPFLRLRVEELEALRDPTLFADPAHLNARGAARATPLLTDWLLRLEAGT
jgi:hypothetical protein